MQTSYPSPWGAAGHKKFMYVKPPCPPPYEVGPWDKGWAALAKSERCYHSTMYNAKGGINRNPPDHAIYRLGVVLADGKIVGRRPIQEGRLRNTKNDVRW
ncbi:uncharacterized protein MCYG_06834 [Microsporum canis CBS 113480]|uniref:Uncharacterized protein n=1 Tax=Arthroderma otae (strain ATCC MYA-4605 / CBS 113480) TaxID=554155 RepID=C5FVT1_ARTOC|nr:uncharacterized protein MCYG_06834 [Microsporum canis CBS 113480]EEQ34015.1 predicted protein [Microsporum canis CBS 113480]